MPHGQLACTVEIVILAFIGLAGRHAVQDEGTAREAKCWGMVPGKGASRSKDERSTAHVHMTPTCVGPLQLVLCNV